MRPRHSNRCALLGLPVVVVLLMAAVTGPSLSQPGPRGYARLLRPQAVAAPDAVTDCRMTLARLRGGCGDPPAAIAEDAFAALRDQCRQAAKAGPAGRRTARL